MFGIVYYAFYKVTGRGYVGVTVGSIRNRFRGHLRSKTYIGNALRKHGIENFKIVQVDQADNEEELKEKEDFYIELFDTLGDGGYNLTMGHTITTGWNGNEETRKAISSALKGRKNPKISEALKGNIPWNKGISTGPGKPFTQDHCKNISNSLRKVTPEQVRAIRTDKVKLVREWVEELRVSKSAIVHIRNYRYFQNE
jgi:group I intron endonuclease